MIHIIIAFRQNRGKRPKVKDVSVEEEEIVVSEPTPLKLASDVGHFDTQVQYRHDDGGNRQMCATLYAKLHMFTENDVARLQPARLQRKSADMELNRELIKSWQYSFQGSIQAILLNGATQTVHHMGGRALWASAGPRQSEERS